MAKGLLIAAYGSEADRARLRALAKATGLSGSEIVVKYIRETYQEVFGDQDPLVVAPPPPKEV